MILKSCFEAFLLWMRKKLNNLDINMYDVFLYIYEEITYVDALTQDYL